MPQVSGNLFSHFTCETPIFSHSLFFISQNFFSLNFSLSIFLSIYHPSPFPSSSQCTPIASSFPPPPPPRSRTGALLQRFDIVSRRFCCVVADSEKLGRNWGRHYAVSVSKRGSGLSWGIISTPNDNATTHCGEVVWWWRLVRLVWFCGVIVIRECGVIMWCNFVVV